ncbi:hypothetical protein [Aquibacillus saliphilus]|uniref:hypothetical protein n=1 Tax=Aquibacillus saliphilus TaxID=1909422 RepID=UPI001CF07270|nr:hypothetical protein [Aquibacillus saliphilus]
MKFEVNDEVYVVEFNDHGKVIESLSSKTYKQGEWKSLYRHKVKFSSGVKIWVDEEDLSFYNENITVSLETELMLLDTLIDSSLTDKDRKSFYRYTDLKTKLEKGGA